MRGRLSGPLARLLTSLALVACLVPGLAASLAVAQDDAELPSRYENGRFGFVVEWAEPWEPAADPPFTSRGNRDTLTLVAGGATIAVVGVRAARPPAALLDELVAERTDDFPDLETVGSGVEVGPPVVVAVALDYEAADGTALRETIEVRSLEFRQSLIAVALVAPRAEFAAALADAQEGIALDGEAPLTGSAVPADAPPSPTPAASPAVDGTPVAAEGSPATGGTPVAVEEDASPAAEATAAGSPPATPTDEPTASPSATPSEEPTVPATATTAPTATPEPTATEEPTEPPTATAEPTATPVPPTATPEPPTATAEPTATEEPTEEPTATEEPADVGAGVEGDAYTSPTFGFTLGWDGDEWTVDAATSQAGTDTLQLSNGTSLLFIEAGPGFDGDPEACLAETVESLSGQDGVTDYEQAEDGEGDPIEGEVGGEDEEDGAGVYAVYTFRFGEDGGEFANYVECRTLVEGEAVLLVVQVVEVDEFNDQIDPVAEVLDSIVLEGEGGLEDPGADRDDEEDTPEADGDELNEDEDDEDARATEEAEQTEEAEEADETEEAEEAAANEDDEDDEEPAARRERYTSPGVGFTVEWDGEEWERAEEDIEGTGFDILHLTNGVADVYFEGVEGFEGSEVTCLNEQVARLRGSSGVRDVEPYEDADGERVRGFSADRAYAAYRLSFSNGARTLEFVQYVDCRAVGDGASVFLITAVVPAAEYEEQAAGVLALIDAVEPPED